MPQSRRYESADRLERLQISQADKLAQGWSLIDDDHPVTIALWLLAIAATTATLVSFIQILGFPLLGVLMLSFILMVAIAFILIRKPKLYQRFALLGMVWLGFVFSIIWEGVGQWLQTLTAVN